MGHVDGAIRARAGAGRTQAIGQIQHLLHFPGTVHLLQAPDLAATPVGGEVHAVQLRMLSTTIDAEIDHADALIHMAVFSDGWHAHLRIVFRISSGFRAVWILLQDHRERMAAAHELPAIVLTALAARRLHVDFFPVILTDVGDVHVTRLGVKTEGPGVTQTVGPDFRLGFRMHLGEGLFADAKQGHLLKRGDEGIILRDVVSAVTRGFVHVDAQHLAEVGVQILAGIDHITFPAAVTDADVKVAIRTKSDLAAVMVAVGEIDLHQHLHAFRIEAIRIGFGDAELSDHRRAVEPQIRVGHIHLAVVFKVGVKGHAVHAQLQEG